MKTLVSFPSYDELLRMLRSAASREYDAFNSKLTQSGVLSLGCTTPFLRSVARRYKDCFMDFLALPVHDYYEIDMLKGMSLVLADLPFADKSPLLREFADTIENWAVCDSNTIRPSAGERESYFDFFCSLARDNHPFVCRYGLVNLLSRYIDESHIDAIFALLSDVAFGEYYVDMAVAWLVAEAMAKCRDKTVVFMENDGKNILDAFTYNKSLQKMRDSYRVSAQDKQWSKTLQK